MANVLLIYPPSDQSNQGIELDEFRLGELPFGVMSLASFLEENGHSVTILDGRVYTKKELFERIERRINKTDYVGISILTLQIKYALRIAEFIKEKDGDIPLVWGGIHTTLFPLQTVQDPLVDFAVHGEGEYPFLHLIKHLENGKPDLGSIGGLAYKKNGEASINTDNPPLDVSKLPDPAYHLIEIERYLDKKLFNGKKVRSLGILTSRGCPYRCAFCTNRILTAGKWRPLPTERVIDTLDTLIGKYKLNHILFVDDFFFGNKKRVEQILDTIIQKNYNIAWEANIRVDNFNSKLVNDEFLKAMKKSGCLSLRMGVESGSNRVLKILKKDITVEQTINAIEQCKKHEITPLCYFMTGIPGETIEEAKDTYHLIFKLQKIYPKTRMIVPAIFRPYPGGELYTKCVESGFKEPTNLKEWGKTNLDEHYLPARSLPWIKNPDLIKDLRDYFIIYNAGREESKLLYSVPLKTLGKIAELRFRRDMWGARIEPIIINQVKNLLKPKWRA